MAISKKKRMIVYEKYDGHCAYCGGEIAYKDMQVDHFMALKVLRSCEDDKELAGRLRRIAEELTKEITGHENEG